ncbi:MAG: metal-dependent hydrolase [Novosphingobium sp. 63-713]|uniref:amidohydrolase n=1 Tax=unclassified Novosphingobium TaxID=2644732 RepID=UPI0009621691|nr:MULTISPECIES: amidohydrolase [unclassified Novosphingobium]MBN9144980.1 amidohydrolase [Novosphingobium sp.]MDR6708901.1 putative amidohydrolase YtcJ [Novosphingobium sp. 1748]OJX89996.1 MAG: metal-dependent hydrolase [Novosphingobium sp. 63-713]
MRLSFAALVAGLLCSGSAHADTLVDHVRGLTLNAAGNVERFNGIVIDRDGRVLQLLHEDDPRPTRLDFAADGRGAVLLPGLIDAHAHVMGVGIAALTLDLSDTTSLAQAQGKIRAYAAQFPGRPWIIGRGWNQELWQLGRFPTAAELDVAVDDRPVWLERVDGHAGWANSKALAAAGVTAATKDPSGGRIERLPASPAIKKGPAGKAQAAPGRPAGVLVDGAMALVAKIVPPPRPEDRDAALAKAQELFLSRGVTAAADMGTSIEDWQTMRRAGDEARLKMRVMAYGDGIANTVLIGGPGPTPWLYGDRLRLNGVKLYLDGALGSRGAWLKAPYADAATSGLPFLTETQLKNLMSRAAMDHFQVAVHAIGDAANATLLSAIEDVAQTYQGDRRWRIEHAQIVDPADIPRFGRNGIIASMQPIHQTSDRIMAEARLGPNRLNGAYAWASMLKAGARLAFGSDAPVEVSDPFAGMAAAITREGADGQPAGGWQPQEKLTRTQALAAYTTGAAFAGFAEGKLGQLRPGWQADFVLVDVDPMTDSAEKIRGARVLQTWVEGKPVWELGKK